MSKRHSVPEDLHKVASVAGTTAVVAETAAVAAERAQEIAVQAQEIAVQAQETVKSRRSGLVLVLLLAVLAAVGIVLWKRSQAKARDDIDSFDLPLEPVDLSVGTTA